MTLDHPATGAGGDIEHARRKQDDPGVVQLVFANGDHDVVSAFLVAGTKAAIIRAA
jgi:hypothetical protein